MKLTGVDEGARTLDRRNHNPELYQLSYAHQQSYSFNLKPTPYGMKPGKTDRMAHPAGFEPATIRLEGGCSIQLSYGRPDLIVKRIVRLTSTQ